VYIVLALFLSVGLDPIVRALERKGLKRGAGIAIVFCAFAVVVTVFVVFVLPPVLTQIVELVHAIPAAIDGIPESDWFAGLAPDTQAALLAGLDQTAEWVSDPSTLAALGGGVLAVGGGLVAAV